MPEASQTAKSGGRSGGSTGRTRAGRPAGRPYGDPGAALLGAASADRSGRAGHPGRPGHRVAEPAYGHLGVDLAAPVAPEPRHPDHRQPCRHDGRDQPPEDLHALRVGTAGAPRPRGAPSVDRSGRADPFVGAVGELLVLPDRHLGLEGVDQRPRRASNASPRWAAVVATTTAMSPISSRPTRCTAATPCTSCSSATAVADARAARRARSGARSTRARARPARGRGRGPGRRRGSARRRPSSSSAASTSATSSGVSRRSTSRTTEVGAGVSALSGTEPTLGHPVTAGQARPRSANARDR